MNYSKIKKLARFLTKQQSEKITEMYEEENLAPYDFLKFEWHSGSEFSDAVSILPFEEGSLINELFETDEDQYNSFSWEVESGAIHLFLKKVNTKFLVNSRNNK